MFTAVIVACPKIVRYTPTKNDDIDVSRTFLTPTRHVVEAVGGNTELVPK